HRLLRTAPAAPEPAHAQAAPGGQRETFPRLAFGRGFATRNVARTVGGGGAPARYPAPTRIVILAARPAVVPPGAQGADAAAARRGVPAPPPPLPVAPPPLPTPRPALAP